MSDPAGHSRRVTRALFLLSDAIAWILVVITGAVAVLFPLMEPVYSQMEHRALWWPSVIATSAFFMALAIGAYALTRRRLAGLLPLALASLPTFLAGNPRPPLIWLACVALVFGAPFALAWREARVRTVGAPGQPS